MDAVTDDAVTTVTVMKSARVGYTKCLDNIVGYFIDHDPCPVLVVQPRVEDAEDYSRTEIAPMLRDTPVLAAITGDLRAKDIAQRIQKRMFSNGASVSFVGANSPGGFRRITARIVLFDEVDGFPADGAGREGDQIALGSKRSETFWNRKIVLGSTPTIKGVSRVEKSWEDSDQRRYMVPCPHCGHSQALRWANLQWQKEVDDQGIVTRHLPETAFFLCESGNGCVIEESDKQTMIDAGKWVALKPSKGHAGFHIWAAYSLFPNAAWHFLVEEFLRVHKDPALMKTFANLVLGETWEEEAEAVDGSSLVSRIEGYDRDSLPSGALYAVAGVDTQGDRLELQIVAFGKNEESWVAGYHVLQGDPAQGMVWADLDALLLTHLRTEDGRELRVRACCIDSGGHHAANVYAFCRTRARRRVFATKGAAGPRMIWPSRSSRTKTNDRVFIVGVSTAKDQLYARLRITKPGPGYVHFPSDGPINQNYFDQLTSERVVTRFKSGVAYRVWHLAKGKRNEALDTFVLAMAALKSLPVRLDAIPRQDPAAAPVDTDADATGSADDLDVAAMVAAVPDPPGAVQAAAQLPPQIRRPARRISHSSYL